MCVLSPSTLAPDTESIVLCWAVQVRRGARGDTASQEGMELRPGMLDCVEAEATSAKKDPQLEIKSK